MNKILFFFLLLISTNLFAKNNHPQLKNSLLWKITGKHLTQPSYLYGTMHLICDLSTTNKEKVQRAVEASKQLYLEVDLLNPEVIKNSMGLLNNETKIKDLKNQQKKQLLLTLIEKHFSMKGALIENSTLFTIFSMLAYKSIDSCALPTSVEETLESKFNHDRSKIAGLETMAEQMQFLRDSEVANLDNVIVALEEFMDMKDVYEAMDELYMAENISGLYDLMTTPTDAYSQDYLDKMIAVLLDERNKNWVQQIPAIATQTPTLFAVGAGHLGGKNGVVHLLRQAGFTVEAVMD